MRRMGLAGSSTLAAGAVGVGAVPLPNPLAGLRLVGLPARNPTIYLAVLSERDHRILEAIEANLTRESPRLARLLSAPPRLRSWQRRSYDVLLLCAVATSLLCLAFAAQRTAGRGDPDRGRRRRRRSLPQRAMPLPLGRSATDLPSTAHRLSPPVEPVRCWGAFAHGASRRWRVGVENPVTSCDLHVFVDDTAEPVSS